MIAKRLFDIFFSILLIIILFPIFLTIGILIKLTSSGPVIFKQERFGYRGKVFIIWKFRTMIDKNNGAPVVSKDDPRIIKLGKFLRPIHLDEIPQLWNILKGDMSFVGPRPLIINNIRANSKAKEVFYKSKPGLTGVTQLKGREWIARNRENALELELNYAQNRNLWKDIKILTLTPITILDKNSF